MTGKPAKEQIEVIAAVAKVTTLADGGIRITLDLPESAIIEAAWLMTCKRDGVAVKARFEKDDD